MKFNTNLINQAYFGSTPISKIYKGSFEIFSGITTTTTTNAPLIVPTITTTNYALFTRGTVSGDGSTQSPLTYSLVNGKYSTFTISSTTFNVATLIKTNGGGTGIYSDSPFTFNGTPATHFFDFDTNEYVDYRVTLIANGTHTVIFQNSQSRIEVSNCGSNPGCQASFTLAFS